MILADTSIWIDHLRGDGDDLKVLLSSERVLMHPFVLGELALGAMAHRTDTLRDLADLPMIGVAHASEVMALIETARLWSQGIGYVDAHLLASVRLDGFCRLHTRDNRLAAAAIRLGVG